MRKILAALAVVALCTTTASAQTLVQYKFDPDANPWATDATEVINPDSTMTAGNTVVIAFTATNSNRSVSSVTDAGGNTYSLVISCEVATDREVWVYSSILTSNAASATVVLSSSIGTGGSLFLWELSGAHASDSIGGSACAAVSSPSPTGHSSGTVTAQGATSFYVGATYGSATASPGWVIDASYTQNTQNTTHTIGYRSTTGNDSFDSTPGQSSPPTVDSELSVTFLVEVLPAASAGGAKQNFLLGGLGR